MFAARALAAMTAMTALTALTADAHAQAAPPYLYVWARSADTTRPRSFLAVVDLRDGSPTTGRVVRVLPAGQGMSPHHTEHQLERDGVLFANDFDEGRTYRFDLSTPGDPKLLGSFTTAGPYKDPHSFVMLASGDRLATYQKKIDGTEPGGLAQLKVDGTTIRHASAAPASGDSTQLVPYSLEVLAPIDRVVSTSTSMTDLIGVNVQVWRLSDLKLLRTLPIPVAAEHASHQAQAEQMDSTGHNKGHHLLPGEPRALADGRTVMFGTFSCGLYRVTDLETDPKVEYVYSFPGLWCAVPVVVGRYWVWTIPEMHAVVSLDVSDPAAPKEISRLQLGPDIEPHWLAKDEAGTRLAVNSGGHNGDARLFLLRIDPMTGRLGKDPSLPVIDLGQVDVPGVGTVRAVPHGTVFAR